MRIAKFSVIATVLCILTLAITLEAKKSRNQDKLKYSKSSKSRKLIIQCCGANSCTKLNTTLFNKSKTTHKNGPGRVKDLTIPTTVTHLLVENTEMDNSTTAIVSATEEQTIAFIPKETQVISEVSTISTLDVAQDTQSVPVSTASLIPESRQSFTASTTPTSLSPTITSTVFLILTSTTTIPTSSTTPSASSSTQKPVTTSIQSTTKTATTASTTTSTSTTSTTTTTTSTRAPTTLKPGSIYDCSHLICQRNNSLFDSEKNLVEPKMYGSWREICGELYLFGKSIVTWERNVERCCSIGMTPIAFETEEKFRCLTNLTKQELWRYNYNYWTSARRLFSNNTFQWCLSLNGTQFTDVGSMWAVGQPDNRNNSQNCIHLSIPRDRNTTELTDRNCNDTYVFACKGIPTPAPKCDVPVCPGGSCDKKLSLYTTALDKSSFLSNPESYGTWVNINYRIYMFGNTAKTWEESLTACCDIGMKLLSVDNDYEYGVLANALQKTNQQVSAGTFWTSGTDFGCTGAFGWCAVNKLVRAPIWSKGHPQSGKNCVSADLSVTNTTLSTNDCTSNLKYICETRDTGSSASGGRAIKDECASIYNISTVEQDNIFNSTSFNIRIKCFLKCLGENGGVIVNGRIVDEQLIKLAETLSPNNSAQLMNDLKAVDACSSIKGMDECDTAALSYQCGQEKAPTLLSNAITAVELNNTVVASPLQPSLGQCITDYACVLNPNKRLLFETKSTPTPDGIIEDICGKKYFAGNAKVLYREAASLCCEYGLNLISLETVDELKCLVAASLGNFIRPAKVWMAVSRRGTTGNKFRWCSSNTPFNVSDWYWNNINGYPEYFVATIYLQTTFPNTYFNTDPDNSMSILGYPLCEEQSL
ncbi:uncharacterized protein LOC132202085 [Neocloeon triangulifer]|uniref:uncharacterized protein LOC132202085 n=1 Tax=Neocloeon triangulifer TaxID=2078957 RepID=UPI00286F9CA5|nr:uncharacterized protein LOC132202085 [Neocloeon triangulifer]